MILEEILACPSCNSLLYRGKNCFECALCSSTYPTLEGNIIDFLSDCTGKTAHWDRAAERDDIYAAAAVQKQDANDIFVKLPPLLPICEFDRKIYVDLGCGYGRTLIYANIIGHPKISIGVDSSIVMLRKAREYAHQYGFDPVLIRADINFLPLQSSVIDIIYSSAVLLHIQKREVRKILQEVSRVLRKEGSVVFESSFPGWLNPDGFQTKVVTSLFSRLLSPAWVRTYSYQEISAIFADTENFASIIIEPEGYKILPKSFFKYSFPKTVKRMVNSINESISRSLHFKNLFVSGWFVSARK